MTIKTTNPIDKKKAIDYFEKLINKDCIFELTEIKSRSLNQNRYLHLILGWFSIETGYNLEYTKVELYKKLCNPETYYEIVKGKLGEVKQLRSSKDLDSKEMTLTIERFRNWSSRNGIYLPTPDEKGMLNEIMYQIKKNKEYL